MICGSDHTNCTRVFLIVLSAGLMSVFIMLAMAADIDVVVLYHVLDHPVFVIPRAVVNCPVRNSSCRHKVLLCYSVLCSDYGRSWTLLLCILSIEPHFVCTVACNLALDNGFVFVVLCNITLDYGFGFTVLCNLALDSGLVFIVSCNSAMDLGFVFIVLCNLTLDIGFICIVFAIQHWTMVLLSLCYVV